MELFLILIIAISLSMDAFSLSLAYGTLGINKKQIYILAIIVGIFHFFMPLIGMIVGNALLDLLKINTNFIVFIVLSVIGLEMIYESFKTEEQIKIMKILEMLVFAFAVSIDSFSVGITLTSINDNYLLTASIFAITSAFFTLIGLLFGNKIKSKVGKVSTILGGLSLILIGITYIL